MSKFEITGTFKVIMEDEYGEDNAVMQCMDNYLGAVKDECDEYFKSVKFELYDCKELKE